MCGYDWTEVMGRNCRFLHGPGTDRRTVLEIRGAVREERSCQVRILNYTKQGRPFWILFHMAPIYSKQNGNVTHYVGVQTPVAPRLASGVLSQTQQVVSGTVKELVEGKSMKAGAKGEDFPQAVERPIVLRLRGGGGGHGPGGAEA